MDRRKQRHGSHGHFLGFWARLNCENMPVIPAWLVRRNLEDPRRIPYLLVWKDDRHDGKIMEVVRLAHGGFSNLVELKRRMRAPQFCESCGGCCPTTAGALPALPAL